MTTQRFLATLLWATVLCLLHAAAPSARAADLSLKLQLIWGTDLEKPKDKDLKEIAPELKEKLKKIFKWKNYFEVTQKPVAVAKGHEIKTRLSDKCEIVIKNIDGTNIEVQLIGEGKKGPKITKELRPNEPITIGGASPNDSAWFVVITSK